MAQTTVADDPLVARRGLTRAQYDAIIDAGLLEGERVELLEGVLVEMVPQGFEHISVIMILNRWLSRNLPDPWLVGPQMPLAVSATSEPEPDISVVQLRGAKPQTAELVIEVAYSSQRKDLVHKPRLYAGASVAQYWVIDLPAREVVVHTDPQAAGAAGDPDPDRSSTQAFYASVQRLPWTTPLSVLGVPVDLANLLTDLAGALTA